MKSRLPGGKAWCSTCAPAILGQTVRRSRLSSSSVNSSASVMPAPWTTPRIGTAPSSSRLASSAAIASGEPMSSATASTATPRASSARTALIFCPGGGVVGVAVPVAARRQSGAAGEDHPTRTPVRQPAGRQQTECTQATGDQVGRIGTTAQRLADRLAGDRLEAGRKELAIAQRQDRLRRGSQHRGKRRHQRTDRHAVRQVDQTAPQLRLLGPDDAGRPPQRALCDRGIRTAFAHTAGDDPQRGRVTLVALGQSANQVDQLHRHPHRAVDIAFTGT